LDERQFTRYERRKQRTREMLKEAAAALLVEKGYEALTIADITDKVDLARATFYVHFKDKDEAIWAVLEDSFNELNRQLQEELADSPDRHYQKLLRVFQYAHQNQALLQVMLGERGHIKLVRRMTQYLARVIERDIELGITTRYTDAPVPYTAQFMAGAMVQIIAWWLEQPDAYTSEQMTDLFYELEVRRVNTDATSSP
jgi:AcrR family transcriptional regulator